MYIIVSIQICKGEAAPRQGKDSQAKLLDPSYSAIFEADLRFSMYLLYGIRKKLFLQQDWQ